VNKRRKKIIVIVLVAAIATIGSAITQKFLLGHRISSENPVALPRGTSLLSQGLDSNRQQFASLTTDTGETITKGKFTKLSFDTLGNWTFIEGKTPIPDEVKKFDSQDVELSGFMMPLTQTDKITEFLMIQALWQCCYGRPPAVNHVVMVKMKAGQSVPYYPEPIRVRGKFHVGETKDDGYLVSLYRLEAEEIQAK
jgi:hypothetical protein